MRVNYFALPRFQHIWPDLTAGVADYVKTVIFCKV
jgi:hypothetical protein